MGTGAFAVLLLRLTEKRFSATQYALFSSLFALPRVLAGPVTGFAVSAVGWSTFFLATMAVGVPGLLMLGRFVPLGVREPDFEREAAPAAPTMTATAVRSGALASVALAVASFLLLAVLGTIEVTRAPSGGIVGAVSQPSRGGMSGLGTSLWQVLTPSDVGGWVQLAGVLAFSLVGGVFVAAIRSRRS
jgi:PAT family beta-lactamase induction signal transducer AmpG